LKQGSRPSRAGEQPPETEGGSRERSESIASLVSNRSARRTWSSSTLRDGSSGSPAPIPNVNRRTKDRMGLFRDRESEDEDRSRRLVHNLKRLMFLRRIAAADRQSPLSGAANIQSAFHVSQNLMEKPNKAALFDTH
jgi:hypothetical protein